MTTKRSIYTLMLLFVAFFIGCEDDVQDIEYGTPSIFMPQATISNLNYAVPSGRDSATYNFKITGDKVNIILGVARSGKQSNEAFTVNVTANADTVGALLSSNILTPANTMVLPSAIYTLPASVTVPAGANSASFYLSVDKAQLKTYAGKKLAIGVLLKEPSKYALNNTINKVVVIIDVNALKLP